MSNLWVFMVCIPKVAPADTGGQSGNHSPRCDGAAWEFIHPHLYNTVGIQKQALAADAAVDAAQGHVQAEGEEVAVVEMSNTVVQPGWKHVQFNFIKVEN